MLRTAIAFSVTLAIAPAFATDIQKCVDPAGKVEYRNSNCPSGTNSASLELPVTAAGTIEIRRSADNRDLRRDVESKEMPERPARALAPRKAEPVNALPPAPAGREKQD
jgi:hypothetical protein